MKQLLESIQHIREEEIVVPKHINETIDYLYSNKGFDKRIRKDGNEIRIEDNKVAYTVNKNGKVEYTYSFIRRFCKTSK